MLLRITIYLSSVVKNNHTFIIMWARLFWRYNVKVQSAQLIDILFPFIVIRNTCSSCRFSLLPARHTENTVQIKAFTILYLAWFGLLCNETSTFLVAHGSPVTSMAGIYSLHFLYNIVGTLVHWCTGSLVHWCTSSPGALVHLVHWFTCMVYWWTGSPSGLVRLCTGSLVYWCIGSPGALVHLVHWLTCMVH